MATLKKKSSKGEWLKKHLLLNLGFVPKLFGYKDDDFFRLTQGQLKKWICGVEYYYGLTLKGTEQEAGDLPQALIKHKLIKVMHAPFVREEYPYRAKKWGFDRFIQICMLSRAEPNPWHRLPKVAALTKAIGADKINVHAVEIVLAPHWEKLFRELNKLSQIKKVKVCLENTIRDPFEQPRDKVEWSIAHNPLRLIEYIKQSNLENLSLNIDTAHLAASGYNVLEKWEKIKRFLRGDVNSAISHFHLVDYDAYRGFTAAALGDADIGVDTFRRIVGDLYELDYQGTISIEAAPLYLHKNKLKCFFNAGRRWLWPFNKDLIEEEEYLLEMICKISN
jgi:sugar phosphate isomerase/epimerase